MNQKQRDTIESAIDQLNELIDTVSDVRGQEEQKSGSKAEDVASALRSMEAALNDAVSFGSEAIDD